MARRGSVGFRPLPGDYVYTLVAYDSATGRGLKFCSKCGTRLCGTREGEVHDVTLEGVDGERGVQIELHIFVGSRAP